MIPLYQTIRAYLQDLIATDVLQPDEKLPSERTLVDRFGSTRITVREALIRLESEGLIYRSNRRGWFIAPKRFLINPTQKVNFTDMAIAQQREPHTEVLESRRTTIPPDIAAELNVRGNTGFYLFRVRSLDGRSVMAEEIYLDPKRFPLLQKKDLSQSVTDLLRKDYGVEIASEYCNIQVMALNEEIAATLATNNGAPCLKIIRKRFNEQGELIDYNIEYWIHNAIEMETWGK